jgi:hypothetical protein
MNWKLALLAMAGAGLVAGTASASDFTVRGSGDAPIKGSKPEAVRALATREAKRRAVVAAIDKILGADASQRPEVAEKVDEIVGQVGDDTIVDSSSQAVGDQFEVTLTLSLDDKTFRELLSDEGVAINTATARSYSILAVMDEYRTTPKDLQAPVEELVEFSSEKGDSYSDTSAAGRASNASSARAASSAYAVDAQHSSQGSASGGYDTRASGGAADETGSAHFNGSASGHMAGQYSDSDSVRGAAASASSAQSASRSSAYVKLNVQAEDHDNVYYKSLVKFQPQSTAPETLNRTYGALVGELQNYDLRVLDNDVFKSKYFKDSPLTLDRMVNGAELARYVQYAKTDANADFFMAGTSVIVDSGRSPTTDQFVCSGLVTAKVYSTVDGEVIASETVPETASGMNSDDCAAAVARKLAVSIGPRIGEQVETYWKRRSMYGRELVLTLQGPLSLGLRARFASAVAALPGVDSSVQREASASRMEFTVSYKGSVPIDQALAGALAADPAFANLDSRSETGRVLMCLGPCPASN